MIVDKNMFFREVSVRICGSLEIEKALSSCFEFLQGVIPIDELMLVVYDRELGSTTITALADSTGGRSCAEHTPLPSCLRREFEEEVELHIRTRRINAFDDPIVSYVARRRHWEESSLLVNRLIVDGQYVGALVARVEGRDRYTDEHLHLWALVNEPCAIALANNQQYREVSRLKDLLADDKSYLEEELRKASGVRLVGAEFGLKRVMEGVRLVAPLMSPVLITGQTGTGKELIANAIHDLSPRRDGPLIKVNCGAIPDTLVDSELFGYEKGAFTGAYEQKRGRFERAHRGTIFLDEVSELPPAAQVRLLRVLQEKEIERVGGGTPMKVDVRVVSATNRNLQDLVARGLLREDLFFRLNVFPIFLPPLKERKTDIPALVHHFIEKKSRQMVLPSVPTLAPGEIDRLMAYDWPGNVRELENAVERAIIVSRGKPLSFRDILNTTQPMVEETDGGDEPTATLRESEAKQIRRALEKAQGKVSGAGSAAEILGINPGTLRHRMRKLGIPFGRQSLAAQR